MSEFVFFELSEDVRRELRFPPHPIPVRRDRQQDVFLRGGQVDFPAMFGEIRIFLEENPELEDDYRQIVAMLAYITGMDAASRNFHEQAVHIYETGLDATPDSVSLRSHYALSLACLGRDVEARREIEEVIARTPKDKILPVLWMILARIYGRDGEYAKAYWLLKDVSTTIPESEGFWDFLGEMKERAGIRDGDEPAPAGAAEPEFTVDVGPGAMPPRAAPAGGVYERTPRDAAAAPDPYRAPPAAAWPPAEPAAPGGAPWRAPAARPQQPARPAAAQRPPAGLRGEAGTGFGALPESSPASSPAAPPARPSYDAPPPGVSPRVQPPAPPRPPAPPAPPAPPPAAFAPAPPARPASPAAPAPSAGDDVGVCAKCRSPLTPRAKFCLRCGTPVAPAAPAVPASPAPPPRARPAPPPASMCTACGSPLQPGAKFCLTCGAAAGGGADPSRGSPPVRGGAPASAHSAAPPPAPGCRRCGAALPPGTRFCLGCGTPAL